MLSGPLLLQVSMRLKLAQMWDHNGTNMEVRVLSCSSLKRLSPCSQFVRKKYEMLHRGANVCGAARVQAIGFMYRSYKVLVSLDAREDVVGE